MCLAIPGKIISISGEKAIADFSGIEKEINIVYVAPKIGDYVIVHAGFAIEIMLPERAKEIFDDLDNHGNTD